MNKIAKSINLMAFLLSPVCIGSGEYKDPFTYAIKNNVIYYFDTYRFISKLEKDKKAQLMYLLKNPSESTILETQKFIRDNFEPEAMKDIVSESYDISKSFFTEEYTNKIGNLANKDPKNRAINQLQINTLYRSGNEPLLAGSSIKGSFRTALLNKLAEEVYGSNVPDRFESDLEFKGIKDPFKIFKFTDFQSIKSPKIWLGYFYNFKRGSFDFSSSPGLKVATEVLEPFKQFSGKLNIHKILESDNPYLEKIKHYTENKASIFKLLNEHYKELFFNDYEKFKKKAPGHQFIRVAQQQTILENLEKNKFAIMKVGHHSGAEGVTIKDRKVTIRYKEGERTVTKNAKHPTTTWYFSQKNLKNADDVDEKITTIYPMGWVVLI